MILMPATPRSGAAGSRRSPAFWLAFALLTVVPLTIAAADDPKPDPRSIEFFEKEVRPVLVKRCISCHGPAQQFSSLRVDSREALLQGGNQEAPGLFVQPNLYCHRQFPDDIASIRAFVGTLGAIDLGEPFLRIREAMTEARKMGVSAMGSRAA